MSILSHPLTCGCTKCLEAKRGRPVDPQSRVAVAGDYMTISIAQFQDRADVLLHEEQRKANPDNSLVAFLCEAVRMSREYVNAMKCR